MKVSKFLQCGLVFSLAYAQSLLQQTATAQDIRDDCKNCRHCTPTADGGHCYVVEQVDRVADEDASEATLTCVDMAHGSRTRIRVLGIATAQRGTSSQKNLYLVPVNKLTFYPWREHGHWATTPKRARTAVLLTL